MLQREKVPAFQASSPNKLSGRPFGTGPFFVVSDPPPCTSRCRSLSVIGKRRRDTRETDSMADEEKQPSRLQVATMRPEDSGRGLARLPRRMMDQLALGEGDVIEIAGKRATPARAVGP